MKLCKRLKGYAAGLLSFIFILTALQMPGMEAMAADTTPPLWVGGYPIMDNTTHPSGAANIKVDVNETGKVYYVALPAGSPAPLAAEVKAGTGKSGAVVAASGSRNIASANTVVTVAVTSLPDAKIFDAYLVAEDGSGNLQQAATKVRISTGMLAHYGFEGSAVDDSGNGNDGTSNGSVSYAGGFSGQALSLNGSGYISMPDRLLQSNDHFTVSLRFKTTSSGVILGYQSGSPQGAYTNANEYIPMIYVGDTDGKLHCELWVKVYGTNGISPNGYSLTASTGYRVNDGSWHKVVLTGTTTSIDVYVDGTQLTSSGIRSQGDTVNGLDMYWNQIGMAKNDNGRPGCSKNGWNYFTGLIDDVYILSEGINSTQVGTLTNDAPPAGNIATYNGSGSSDAVTVTGLSGGDIVRVYDASTGGSLLNSGTVSTGASSVSVPVTFPGSGASGLIYVSVQKAGDSSESPRTAVSYLSEAAQGANDSIAQAKSLLPTSFTATAESDTNLLSYLNSIAGMSGTGVTLSLSSYNGNISNTGAITYTASTATGNVLVYINKAGGTQDTLMIPVTVPALPQYTVTFDSNDGAPATTSQYLAGSLLTLPPAPTRTGYDFTHWYTETGCENMWDFASDVMPARSMSLFAGWSVHQWSLSFDSKGADGGDSTSSIPVTYGSLVGILPQPTRTGYDFSGWFTQAIGGTEVVASDNYLTDNNTELYAHWNAKNYSVTFDSNQGSSVAGKSVSFGSTFSAPAAPTRSGYSFMGWYSDSSLSQGWNFNTDTMPAGGVTLHARWTPNPYTLHLNPENGNLMSDEPVLFNSIIGHLPTPARTGYIFEGWFTSPNGGGTQYTVDTLFTDPNDVNLYANWTGLPKITSQPSTSIKSIGDTAVLTILADSADHGEIAYQWQKSSDGGKSWSNISGASGSTYKTPTLTYGDNGVQYRCAVLNTQNSATAISYSDIVTVNVNSPAQSVSGRIDTLPDPQTATDEQIENSAPEIKITKQLYDTLADSERNLVSDADKTKLDRLISRMTALLVVKSTDPSTGIKVNGIGYSVMLPELNDPNTGKVEVALHVTPFSNADQPQNIKSAISLISASGNRLLQAFDVSLLKTVYGVSGNLVSSQTISDSDVVGNITVRIPIPESDLEISDLTIVYIDDSGNVTPLQTTRVTENGVVYLQFVTSHFSEYAIASGQSAVNPETGDKGNNPSTLLWLLAAETVGMLILRLWQNKHALPMARRSM